METWNFVKDRRGYNYGICNYCGAWDRFRSFSLPKVSDDDRNRG